MRERLTRGALRRPGKKNSRSCATSIRLLFLPRVIITSRATGCFRLNPRKKPDAQAADLFLPLVTLHPDTDLREINLNMLRRGGRIALASCRGRMSFRTAAKVASGDTRIRDAGKSDLKIPPLSGILFPESFGERFAREWSIYVSHGQKK